MSEAIADRKRDIERWRGQLAAVEKGEDEVLAKRLRGWIAKASKAVADFERQQQS